MVKIVDITEEENKKENLLEEKLKLMKKHFYKNIYSINHNHLGLSFYDKSEIIMFLFDLKNRLTVYKKIPEEKLLKFGKEYEKIFGVKDFEIITDYSKL
ncbi:hypothetical protein J4411_02390 [Candidatus Pacearchaeota archaeon]|nr:hypothetical protein [Candidatus Pacearchaeota archaeon]